MEPKLQALIFDPPEIAPEGREELNLSGYVEGIEVADKGLDLGDQAVKQFMAEGLFGSKPIDQIWPLVAAKISLRIKPTGSLTFDQVRARLAAKVSEINDTGAVLKRVLPSGKFAYADVVEAHLHLSDNWLAENRDHDLEAMIELQRLPEWYGEPVAGEAHTLTGDGTFTQIVEGDLPARVESLTVTDTSGNNQKGLLWHLRGRHYSAASTASWAYNAEALELLDVAEKVATPLAPAYGTKVVKHPNLSTEWTPILGTSIGGTEFLTHVGVYDVWARVYSTSTSLPWLRLLWDLGDMVSPSENVQAQIPASGGWYLVNLGQVNLRTLPFGAQRWKGVIAGRGESGGENVYIDRLWLLCGDESSGVLRASTESSALPSIAASDSLEGTGALAGSSATRGGKWEASGDAGDLTRSEAGAVRSTESDTNGHTELLSEPTIGPCTVRCQVESSVPSDTQTQGVYLRYFSSTYWVRVSLVRGRPGELKVEYQAGGSVVTSSLLEVPVSGGFYEIAATITADGFVIAGGFSYELPATFREGEAHATGKVGIYDENRTIVPIERHYKTFTVSPPAPADAVIFANRNAKLSTNGVYRESEDGAGYGPVAYPGADLPRLPVSGPAEDPVEVAVKPTRGDTLTLPDAGKDGFTAQLEYRPCWAEIPGS